GGSRRESHLALPWRDRGPEVRPRAPFGGTAQRSKGRVRGRQRGAQLLGVRGEALEILLGGQVRFPAAAGLVFRLDQPEQDSPVAGQLLETLQVAFHARRRAGLEAALQVAVDQLDQHAPALAGAGREVLLQRRWTTLPPGLLETLEDLLQVVS